MEASPSWEAVNCAATQELPSILYNPMVHYGVHKSPPLVSVLSQIKSIHTVPYYLCKIHFNIVQSSTSWSPSGLSPCGFSTGTLYAFIFSPIRAICHNHLILLYLTILIILGEKYPKRYYFLYREILFMWIILDRHELVERFIWIIM
jgi:hypothetical protein